MRKYRVIYEGGTFKPQHKGWVWWKYFCTFETEEDDDGFRIVKYKVMFWDRDRAIDHIKEHEATIQAQEAQEARDAGTKVVWEEEYGEPGFLARVLSFLPGWWH